MHLLCLQEREGTLCAHIVVKIMHVYIVHMYSEHVHIHKITGQINPQERVPLVHL